MSIIKSTFENLEKVNSKALVTYTVAGDPNLDTSEKIISEIVSSGADIIEIGVPFTDPIAEGPVIQKAHDRALKNNTSLELIFKMVAEYRKFDDKTPLVLMGYLNTFIFHKKLIEKNHNDVVDSKALDIDAENTTANICIL